MTLEQAIDRYTNNAEYERRNGSLHGCMEFRQLAEWLKDYKRLLEQHPCERFEWGIDGKIYKITKAKDGKEICQQVCEDAISREAALEKMADYVASGYADSAEDFEEYSRIICQLPSITQKPIVCDDAISREDAEQMFRNIRSHLKPQDYKSAEEFNTRDLMLLNAEQMIHALPSVTQKYGKWIEHPEIETSAPEYLMFYECSECGDKQCFCKSDIHKKRFCNNCGAKMVEPQESEG